MLDALDESAIAALAAALVVLAIEGGFRAGRARAAGASPSLRTHVGAMQGALLGLVALLLAFTSSMAVGRFDARKQLVLAEANAISTGAQRAQLLPPEARARAAGQFGRYVDARLAFYEAGVDTAQLRAATTRAARLQDSLWQGAADWAAVDPHDVRAGLYLQSLGDMSDRAEERLAAFENHVPEVLLLLLVGSVALAFVLVGFGSGLEGRRHLGTTTLLALVVVVVLLTIVDLDRPRRGVIRVSQASMARLRAALAPTP